MTIAEAAEKWGISQETVKNKLKISLNKDEIEEMLQQGLIKYYQKTDGKRKEWIISKRAMNKWYGKENKMQIIISKKNNHEHIVGREFEEVYDKFDVQFAKQQILEVVSEFEKSVNLNGLEIEQEDRNEIEAVTSLKEGFYSFDCGDYTYYIEIKKWAD